MTVPDARAVAGPLSPYRVLDLTDESGALCGKMLADLGADVLLIEPPEGGRARRVPPYIDREGAKASLYFEAFNANKRGATIDPATPSGRNRLAELCAGADFVLASGRAGGLEAWNLSPERLLQLNPNLVVTLQSPFGRRGPYASFQGSDLVLAALSGLLNLTGDPDRPPVRVGPVYQSLFHAASEAAVASLAGHFRRQQTGKGVIVDVPALLSSTWATMTIIMSVALEDIEPRRVGTARRRSGVVMPAVFPCKDGHVVLDILGGHIGGPSNRALWRWMQAEGMASPDLATKDWDAWDFAEFARDLTGAQRLVDRISGEAARFLLTHTKVELFDRAVKDGILLAPANSAADLVHSPQLAARDFFWRPRGLPWGEAVYPGAFAKMSKTPIVFRQPAPPRTGKAPAVEWPRRERTTPASGSEQAALPFAGLKVADFTWVAAGPTFTQYLSNYGATVVRVETPGKPDSLRTGAPFAGRRPGINRGGFFARVNTGKLGLALNLSKPEGRALARRLIDWADIVAESFTPGTMKKWGLDYETIAQNRPDLVMISSCIMGQSGPYARYGGFGSLAAALCGVNAASGWADRGPGSAFGAYTDTIVPRFAAAALLAAIDHQRRTGQGQYIDVSQFEASAQFAATAILEYSLLDQDVQRRGNASRAVAPHGVYPVAGDDRWIAIVCRDDVEWQFLCHVLGNPPWAAEPGFATLSGRMASIDRLEVLLARETCGWDGGPLMQALQAAGVPAGVVQTARDLLHDPQITALEYVQWLDHPEMGAVPFEGSRFMLDGEVARLTRSPLLGEHSEEVLRKILGLDDEAVAQAVMSGAVELT